MQNMACESVKPYKLHSSRIQCLRPTFMVVVGNVKVGSKTRRKKHLHLHTLFVGFGEHTVPVIGYICQHNMGTMSLSC